MIFSYQKTSPLHSLGSYNQKTRKKRGKLNQSSNSRSRMRLSFRNSDGKRKENFSPKKKEHAHTDTHKHTHSLALSLLQNSPDRAAHLLKLLENWIDRESFSLSFPTRTSSEACRSDSARETAGKAPAPAANGLTILKNSTKLEQQQATRETISSRSPNPTCWPTQHDLLVV
jgi:hypothetical protein